MAEAKALTLVRQWKCFGGFVKKFKHLSQATRCEMTFSVFLPQIETPVPTLYWLSGLTCTDDNFSQKSGAFKYAAAHEIALVMPDTSPRGVKVEGDSDSWDFGVGAGFYVNATEAKWRTNYNMFDYVTEELPALVQRSFPVNDRKSVFGHSMGGHGALISYLKCPGAYESVSAFAPIANPSNCPWGIKAFTGFLGDNKDSWKAYDACELVKEFKGDRGLIFIDQGKDDEYLEKQLLSQNFEAACREAGHPLKLRYQEGYDHSFFFITTFIEEHIAYHAKILKDVGKKRKL